MISTVRKWKPVSCLRVSLVHEPPWNTSKASRHYVYIPQQRRWFKRQDTLSVVYDCRLNKLSTPNNRPDTTHFLKLRWIRIYLKKLRPWLKCTPIFVFRTAVIRHFVDSRLWSSMGRVFHGYFVVSCDFVTASRISVQFNIRLMFLYWLHGEDWIFIVNFPSFASHVTSLRSLMKLHINNAIVRQLYWNRTVIVIKWRPEEKTIILHRSNMKY